MSQVAQSLPQEVIILIMQYLPKMEYYTWRRAIPWRYSEPPDLSLWGSMGFEPYVQSINNQLWMWRRGWDGGEFQPLPRDRWRGWSFVIPSKFMYRIPNTTKEVWSGPVEYRLLKPWSAVRDMQYWCLTQISCTKENSLEDLRREIQILLSLLDPTQHV